MKKHKGLIPKQCCECQKVFFVYFSKQKQRFCSRLCAILNFKKLWKNEKWRNAIGVKLIKNLIPQKRKNFPKNCIICGKRFQPRKKEHIACSRKCGRRTSKGITAYQGRIGVKCSYCGKELLRPKARILKQKEFWCSNKCMAEIKRKLFKGGNNPRWSGGKIEKKCLKCDEKFLTTKNKKQKYCSRSCAGKRYKNLLAMGGRAEREAKKILESQNYLVIKSGGSKGIFDLWAVNEKELKLIQVKKYKYTHKISRKRILKHFHKEISGIRKLNIIGSKELWVKTKKSWFMEKLL